MKRLIAIVVILFVFTSCSNNSNVQSENSKDSASVEEQVAPLSADEKSELIGLAKNLNVSYNDFEEAYVVDSRPSQSCPGHTIWIQIKAYDGSVFPEFFLLTQDDIGSNIGSPGGVLIKQNGNTFSYPVEDWLGLDNIYCGNSVWAYQSKQVLSGSQKNLNDWLSYFSNPSNKFRLEESWRNGGYRDIKLTDTQRELNLTAIKVLNALINQQISSKELFGK